VSNEAAEIGKQLIHMLVIERRVFDPVIEESIGDGFQYLERIKSVPGFEERNGRVDQIRSWTRRGWSSGTIGLMSVPVLIGFAGVLVAAVASGMLAGRCARQPGIGLIAWTAATLALTAALAAESTGFASGFTPATFRAVQLFALLLAPLWLAWGMAELLWPSEAARFGARLVLGALTVIGSVILVTDPLTAQAFGKSWPPAGEHYQAPSHYALNAAQAVAVLTAVITVGLAAAGARGDRRRRNGLAGAALAGLAWEKPRPTCRRITVRLCSPARDRCQKLKAAIAT
jgi:hypothetical protein